MSADMLQMLIPIVAILAVFGMPVCLVYVWKFFKLKERELTIDAELRRSSGQALEQRVQRLESVILALDGERGGEEQPGVHVNPLSLACTREHLKGLRGLCVKDAACTPTCSRC